MTTHARTGPTGSARSFTPLLVAGIVLGAGALVGSVVHAHAPVRPHAIVGALPGSVAFVLTFLLAEVASYGVHYAMHRVPLLWRFHTVHHSAEELDFLAGTRRHPFDTALSALALASARRENKRHPAPSGSVHPLRCGGDSGEPPRTRLGRDKKGHVRLLDVRRTPCSHACGPARRWSRSDELQESSPSMSIRASLAH